MSDGHKQSEVRRATPQNCVQLHIIKEEVRLDEETASIPHERQLQGWYRIAGAP